MPVGDVPVTVAVNVTAEPATEGFSDDASVVVVMPGAAVTVCESVDETEPLLLASPP